MEIAISWICKGRVGSEKALAMGREMVWRRGEGGRGKGSRIAVAVAIAVVAVTRLGAEVRE